MRNAFLNHCMKKFLSTFQHPTSNGVGCSDDTKINKGYIRKKARFITLSNINFSKKFSSFILEAHYISLQARFYLSNCDDVAAVIFFNLQRLYKRKTEKGDNSVTKKNFKKRKNAF